MPKQKTTSSTKTEIYQSLWVINESLQRVTEHIRILKAAGILAADLAEIRCLTAEQIRSEVNQTATNRLHTRECQDAYRFERQRLTQEEKLRRQDVIASEPLPPVAAGKGAQPRLSVMGPRRLRSRGYQGPSAGKNPSQASSLNESAQ